MLQDRSRLLKETRATDFIHTKRDMCGSICTAMPNSITVKYSDKKETGKQQLPSSCILWKISWSIWMSRIIVHSALLWTMPE